MPSPAWLKILSGLLKPALPLMPGVTPGPILGWKAFIVPTPGVCGRFIGRILPTPGRPSQVRFETAAPIGLPHVPIWLTPWALAANGSTTRPAVASADVRNIRVLADIIGFPSPSGT